MNIAKLKAAALAAGGEEWRTSYIPPYGRHYVVSTDGRTVVNLSDGDVPARYATFIAAANPGAVLELIAERDALREGEMGDAKHSNTRAAADIYFQLVEECEIPAGGSLVEHIDDMRQRLVELEARTLTVKLPDCDLGAVQHMSGGSDDYCNGFVDGTQNAIKALTEACAAILQGKADGTLTNEGTIAAEPVSNPYKLPDGWIKCSERMPEEGGRYWCYVEEINSLGRSHYQWNCSWNGVEWGGEALSGRVTHWMPLPAAPGKEG